MQGCTKANFQQKLLSKFLITLSSHDQVSQTYQISELDCVRPLLLDVGVDRRRRVSVQQPGALQREVGRLSAPEHDVRMNDFGHFGAHDVHVDELRQVEVHFFFRIGEQSIADVVQDTCSNKFIHQ